jgi:hypothetical protein
MIIVVQFGRKGRPALPRKVAAWIRWNGLAARVRSIISNLAPAGYEDETGFHFDNAA